MSVIANTSNNKAKAKRKFSNSHKLHMKALRIKGWSINKIAKHFLTDFNTIKYHTEPDWKAKQLKDNKEYRQDNFEDLKQKKKIHYDENKEYYSEYRKKNHQEHREERLVSMKEYNSRPEVRKRTNAQKQKLDKDYSVELLEKIAKVHGKKSPICFGFPVFGGCSLSGIPESRIERLRPDHLDGKGRKDRKGFSGIQWRRNQFKLSDLELKEKFQILCDSCNQQKNIEGLRKG